MYGARLVFTLTVYTTERNVIWDAERNVIWDADFFAG